MLGFILGKEPETESGKGFRIAPRSVPYPKGLKDVR